MHVCLWLKVEKMLTLLWRSFYLWGADSQTRETTESVCGRNADCKRLTLQTDYTADSKYQQHQGFRLQVHAHYTQPPYWHSSACSVWATGITVDENTAKHLCSHLHPLHKSPLCSSMMIYIIIVLPSLKPNGFIAALLHMSFHQVIF